MKDVVAWAQREGFGGQAAKFQAEEVDGRALLQLDKEDLEGAFGIPPQECEKLWSSILEVKSLVPTQPVQPVGPMEHWGVPEVLTWLQQQGFQAASAAFEAEAMSGRALLLVSQEDLEGEPFHLTPEHSNKLMQAIKQLRSIQV